ncbi:MAG: hypothetical protein KKF27_20970, partial [Gammaproteobacteria bacterium]|nr:hypothetical protein [Gammaproteobacteria bacterium]
TAAVATADTLQEVFDNGQTITVANTDNQTLALVQNDTTNNPAMLTIANTTTGQSVTITHDTVTTGYAVSLSSDGLTTGSAVYLESTSTQGTVSDSSKVLNIARSGANANASHTAYGIYSSVVNSGTTNTNVAGYFTASGASTANYAIQISGALYDGTATLSSGAWSGITTLAAQAGDFTVADNGNDIPLVVTQNDVTNNPIAASITNAGTESGLYINQTGVLAASKYGLYIYSNSAQINGYLAFIHQANVSSTQRALHVTNEGEGYGVYLHKHTTPLAASRAMLKVYSDVANVNASALVDINEASTTSTHVVLQVNNDGLGTGIYVDSDINNTTAGSFDGILVDFDRIGNVSSGSDTVYGLRLTPTHTGASGGTIATYGVHATVAGDAGGTSTAVGGYFTASGADTNIALETGAGAVKIGAVIHYDAEYDNGNSGAAVTIDWNNGNVQKVTMTDNCTFSFTNPPGPGHYTLRSIQDAGGTNTYTWTGGGLTVAWNAGTEPTWSVVGTEVNIHSFYFDGAAWRGDGWTQS